MDYLELAAVMLDKMQLLYKAGPHRNINGAMQGEAFVLKYIASRGSDVLPGEICGEMNVSSARIAQTLNSIEKKGWIKRRIDTHDRRRVLIKLTLDGQNVADEHYRKILEQAAKMLDLLGEEDAKEYVRITGKLADLITMREKELFSSFG